MDIEAWCEHFVRSPRQELVSVKYFTALVKNRPDKPGQRERQKEYLRALGTLPKAQTYYGHFLKRKAIRQLVKPPNRKRKKGGGPQKSDPVFREVWIEEEKGSDVNLASQLLADGFRARYDVAFVVSNDGDLKMPIEIAREEFRASIIVINPHDGRRSMALTPHGTDLNRFYRRVRPGALRSSQLPLELEDENGKIQCPRGWSKPRK